LPHRMYALSPEGPAVSTGPPRATVTPILSIHTDNT